MLASKLSFLPVSADVWVVRNCCAFYLNVAFDGNLTAIKQEDTRAFHAKARHFRKERPGAVLRIREVFATDPGFRFVPMPFETPAPDTAPYLRIDIVKRLLLLAIGMSVVVRPSSEYRVEMPNDSLRRYAAVVLPSLLGLLLPKAKKYLINMDPKGTTDKCNV